MSATTTLNAIRAHGPCADGWSKLLAHLGKTKADDEPLPLLTILDANGLDDALWCMRAMPEHDKHWRLFAVWCARQVQHLMTDQRSISALDVAERHARGDATDAELSAAVAAAWAAWDAAWAAVAAAWAAAGAAQAAAGAAGAAAGAAGAAWDAAWAAVAAAGAAAGDAQAARLREVCAEIDAEIEQAVATGSEA